MSDLSPLWQQLGFSSEQDKADYEHKMLGTPAPAGDPALALNATYPNGFEVVAALVDADHFTDQLEPFLCRICGEPGLGRPEHKPYCPAQTTPAPVAPVVDQAVGDDLLVKAGYALAREFGLAEDETNASLVWTLTQDREQLATARAALDAERDAKLRLMGQIVDMMGEAEHASTVIGTLAKALGEHHQWHLTQGEVNLETGEGKPPILVDNAAEYCDSGMYERTSAALAAVEKRRE